jgi:hypothetical protein
MAVFCVDPRMLTSIIAYSRSTHEQNGFMNLTQTVDWRGPEAAKCPLLKQTRRWLDSESATPKMGWTLGFQSIEHT